MEERPFYRGPHDRAAFARAGVIEGRVKMVVRIVALATVAWGQWQLPGRRTNNDAPAPLRIALLSRDSVSLPDLKAMNLGARYEGKYEAQLFFLYFAGVNSLPEKVSMTKFYDVEVNWKKNPPSLGRGIGNNAAWECKCGEILLGPHEDLYAIPACPRCGARFRVLRGKKPAFVAKVIEVG